jgi:hypothetical protein
LIARLRGFLRGLPSRRPVDILWEWQERGFLGISREDVEAWVETRNPAAHGLAVDPTQAPERLQVRVERFFRLQNLLNRIILKMMGYQGPYVNYSRAGWVLDHFE